MRFSICKRNRFPDRTGLCAWRQCICPSAASEDLCLRGRNRRAAQESTFSAKTGGSRLNWSRLLRVGRGVGFIPAEHKTVFKIKNAPTRCEGCRAFGSGKPDSPAKQPFKLRRPQSRMKAADSRSGHAERRDAVPRSVRGRETGAQGVGGCAAGDFWIVAICAQAQRPSEPNAVLSVSPAIISLTARKAAP